MGYRRKSRRSKRYGRIILMVMTAILLAVLAASPMVINGKHDRPSGSSEETKTQFYESGPEKTTVEEAAIEEMSTEGETAVKESAIEETEPDEGQTTESGNPGSAAQEALDSMTLTEQIYQMFMVNPELLTGVSVATQAGTATEEALKKYPVGGIVYFADNIQTPEQCSAMIENSQKYSRTVLFIAVDEEGGRVSRIGKNSAMGTTAFPSMKTIGDTGDTEKAYQIGHTIGTEISRFGFNLDFAPVADVDSNPANPVIGDRAFSSNAAAASDMVSAAVRGFHDSGILCSLKHFPGHGDTATDSHKGYTEINKTLEELRQTEFVPFQGGIAAGADFVMVGHISVPQVTGDDMPATLSPAMIRILKEELGFQGLIITDSMQMEAITGRYSSGQAAVLAVQAGADMILMPEDLQEAAEGLLEAVRNGQISEERIQESVLKILEAKRKIIRKS